jgi:sulfate adenylyltransferase subunit 1 (EFTu-like GTPase family)
VVRANGDGPVGYRGFAGQVAGGTLRPGDQVVALPSGVTSRIRSIDTLEGQVAVAVPPMSVTIVLEDEVDVSRGDMLVHRDDQPAVGQDLDAMLCWMHATPLRPGGRYALKQTTRATRAIIRDLRDRIDVNSLGRAEADALALNEIGRATLRCAAPLCYDLYRDNRATGGFILIDETTNETVGAGVILGPPRGDADDREHATPPVPDPSWAGWP